MHLFWECTFVQAFWNGIKQWMSKRPCFPSDVFCFQSCLGFVDNTSNILSHHFLLICRYHIHSSKLMRLYPSPSLCVQNFLTCLEVERRYALQNGNLEKFNAKWGAFIRENNLWFFFFFFNFFFYSSLRCGENNFSKFKTTFFNLFENT